MDATPPLPDVTRRTSEPNTPPVTHGSLEGEKDQSGGSRGGSSSSSSSSSSIPGFVGIPVIFLVITAVCILWSWTKRQKRQVRYLQVTPSLTLPPLRQRAKNIYDLLPRQQEELGRHHSSSRVFSTESLLSRNFDSPEHAATQGDDAPQMHRAHIHAVEYTVGIYDNATVPRMCELLPTSAHYTNVGTARDSSSISSNDYVNISTAETLTSSNGTPENRFVLSSDLELNFTEEGHASCGDASDHIHFGDPGTKGSDSDGSSQTSHDYVNMTGLDLGGIQENQPRVALHCSDYENIPPAGPSGNQQQVQEPVTTSNTGEDRTHAPVTHILPVSRVLSPVYSVGFRPPVWSEDSQITQREETSSEDSDDYENVLVAVLGSRGWEQGPGTQLAPADRTSMGRPQEVVCPARSLATGEAHEEAGGL